METQPEQAQETTQTEQQPQSDRPDGEISPILKKILDRRDQMGVTNYWISKRAEGSMAGVYNFLTNRSHPNLKTLASVMDLVGLEIREMENFTKPE